MITVDLESVVKDILNKKEKEEWDNYTPIKKDEEAKLLDVYLTNDIETPFEYNKLVYELSTLDKEWYVTFYINNGGGYTTGESFIISAMNNTEATIKGKLSGMVASAATGIALACDEIEVADDLIFMIHEPSFESASGISQKFSDMVAFQKFYQDYNKNVYKNVYKGFLTVAELKKVHKGEEIWLDAKEVKDRWDKLKSLKNK